MSLLFFLLIGFALGWIAHKDSARSKVENDVRVSISRQLELSANHETDENIASGMRAAAQRVLNPIAFEEARYPERSAVHR